MTTLPSSIIIAGNRMFIPYKYGGGGHWIGPETDYGDETFSFVDYVTGEQWHWHVLRLWQSIRAGQPPFDQVDLGEVDLGAADVDFIYRKHGIEDAGLLRLSAKKLETPGIMCDLPDGTVVVVDGNHRYVRRYRDGLRSMKFYRLTEPQWRTALLDIPEEIGRTMTGEQV